MSTNNRRSFEFRRVIDNFVYRYKPCDPFHGQLAWKREDIDLWVTKVNERGWVCVNVAQEILAFPCSVAVETSGSVPPAGIWVSLKGDKSYVYELVYIG